MGKFLINDVFVYDVYGLVMLVIYGGLIYYVKLFNIREGYIWIKYKRYSLFILVLLRNFIN